MITTYSHYSFKLYTQDLVKIDQMPWSQYDCRVLCMKSNSQSANSITAVLLLSNGGALAIKNEQSRSIKQSTEYHYFAS